jgi:uncharacterized membrane protein
MNESPLVPASLGLDAIPRALAAGWRTAQHSRRVSALYGAIVALLGFVILRTLLLAGMAPLALLAAEAFMLVAPISLAGFFAIARSVEKGQVGRFEDLIAGFRQAPPTLLVLSLVCALLFLIFATDVAILYSYKVGGAVVMPLDMLSLAENITHVLLWGSISGVVFGFIIFAVTAFSVPILCEGRAGLVRAVTASVRGVFKNFLVTLAWAAVMTLATLASILILPLLPFTLPPLAYASHALYREAFPA